MQVFDWNMVMKNALIAEASGCLSLCVCVTDLIILFMTLFSNISKIVFTVHTEARKQSVARCLVVAQSEVKIVCIMQHLAHVCIMHTQ